MPTRSLEELADPFSDLDTSDSDIDRLGELLTPLDCGVTAAEYLNDDKDLSTCLTFDEADGEHWWAKVRAEAVVDCSQATGP